MHARDRVSSQSALLSGLDKNDDDDDYDEGGGQKFWRLNQ